MRNVVIFLVLFSSVFGSPMADHIQKEASILEKRYCLSRSGIGFFGPYKGYKLTYHFYEGANIEKARKLIVSFSTDLQKKTGFFDFTKGFEGEKEGKKTLWVDIYFQKQDKTDSLNIDVVTLFEGKLSYEISSNGVHFKPIYEESFEEALEIISKICLKKDP